MALIKINGERSRRSSKDSDCSLGREKERERESYIVLHKYGESTKMRGEGGRGDPSNPSWYSSDIKPASFAGPPTLKRDGPKQTRSGTAETVLLE